jgi:hypothetical protein
VHLQSRKQGSADARGRIARSIPIKLHQLTTSRKTIDDFPTRLSPSRITLKSAAVDDFRFMRMDMRPSAFFLMGFIVKFSNWRESSKRMPLKSLSVSSVARR